MSVTPTVRKLETSANYGKFDIEPLDPGFGTTLGNTLRRVLLSSLWGAAVTSIQIDGVERGKGYVPADRNKREGQPIGVIPIDAIFSPVEKANFTVEKTRVGQSTDYDRLLIEVWTDGTMSPEEAVSHAASLFTKHLQLFVNFDASIKEKEAKDRGATGGQNRLMDTPIEELDLSVRAFNCLKADEIQTVGQLLQKREEELLALRNFGRKSLDEIKEKLVEKGFIKPEEMGSVLRG